MNSLKIPPRATRTFCTRSELFPTATELFQHFLLDPAKQSTALLSAPPLLGGLNCTVTPCSLSKPIPSLLRPGCPYRRKVIRLYAPAAVINSSDATGGP